MNSPLNQKKSNEMKKQIRQGKEDEETVGTLLFIFSFIFFSFFLAEAMKSEGLVSFFFLFFTLSVCEVGSGRAVGAAVAWDDTASWVFDQRAWRAAAALVGPLWAADGVSVGDERVRESDARLVRIHAERRFAAVLVVASSIPLSASVAEGSLAPELLLLELLQGLSVGL
jgi:hypothetical protein